MLRDLFMFRIKTRNTAFLLFEENDEENDKEAKSKIFLKSKILRKL